MNNDLIRRGELLEKIIKAQNMLRTSSDALWEINQKYFKGLAWANRLVLDEPAVDAVEVVRCLYCIHGEMDDPDFPDQYYCHAGCGWNKADFFCAYGERREDDAHLE